VMPGQEQSQNAQRRASGMRDLDRLLRPSIRSKPTDTPSPEAPKMVPDSHGLVWMPDDAFHRALKQKALPVQANIAASVQRPISVQCIQEPSTRATQFTSQAS
jgi:hypothetical protein